MEIKTINKHFCKRCNKDVSNDVEGHLIADHEVSETIEKWVRVNDMIKYIDEAIKYYQQEYDNTESGTKEYIQRLYELRLLKRIKIDLGK
jgi:hypothetical protein